MLKINSKKSKVMVTCKRQNNQTSKFKFKIQGQELKYVHSYKYLGVHITSNKYFNLAQESLSYTKLVFSLKWTVQSKC